MRKRTKAKAPAILIPEWHETESGLFLPNDILGVPTPQPSTGPRVPADLRPALQPVAISREKRSFLDQIAVYADEPAAGLAISSLEQVRASLATVPFEAAMQMVAHIAAKSFGLMGDQARQLEFAVLVFGEGQVLENLRKFLKEKGDKAQIFAEQHALMLERLIIEEARPGLIDVQMTQPEASMVARCLLGCTGVAGAVVDWMREDEARTMQAVMGAFLQNGDYNSKHMLMGEIVRSLECFGHLAHRPDILPPSKAPMPLDDWMIEDYGCSIDEQLLIGFSLGAMSLGLAYGAEAGSQPYITPDNIADLLLKLGMRKRQQDFFDLISANRETFRREFADSRDDLAGVAWEKRPLMRHPFLRCDGGGLLLLSPRAIQTWIGEGFYYRLLDAAQKRAEPDPKRKLSRDFRGYSGRLLETYALELMESVYSTDNGITPGVRVFGEQPYGPGGQKKTSDVAVVVGEEDLVLFEISSARVRANTLVSATAEGATDDIKRVVIDKVEQLHKCVNALRSHRRKDRASLPDVDMKSIKRIWPVLVTASNMTQTIPLWNMIDPQKYKWLTQPGVQHLTLLDFPDYEALCFLIEYGLGLEDVLAHKNQPMFAERELAIWLQDDLWAPKNITARPSRVESIWETELERVLRQADFSKGSQAPPVETEEQSG